MSTEITRDQWLAALAIADMQQQDPEAKTLAEIAAEFGISHATAYRRMRQLVAEGRAVETQKLIDIKNGGRRPTTAYKLVQS